MKQTELCKKTKIPKSALSQYLSGAFEPKQDRLYLMAQALNVDPVWLMGFDVPTEKDDRKKFSDFSSSTKKEQITSYEVSQLDEEIYFVIKLNTKKGMMELETWPKTSTTAERLKEAMDDAHIKQADLAKATGLSKGGISNYVLGRYEPKSDVINKLAKALNCSEMWLWGYDVPKERQNKISFDELQLTEGKKLILELLDQLSEEEQIKAAQSFKSFMQMPDDYQKLVNQMVQAAVNNQK